MKADASHEQRFIADVDAFECIAHDLEAPLHAMQDWLAQLAADLQSTRLTAAGLQRRSVLAARADAVNASLQNSVLAWSARWAALQPAQKLAESFDDQVLLLVFGKFNAGKSSFCNLLAERFAACGKTVEYFHLDAGHIVETAKRFREGATETTTRLQGVRLGGKLVLVDTPGLHSVTPDNAALTQRFTDSADGVLWLTSSTSPGQVQELDELSRELHRNKPLLPVVTRSDVFEEDEVDGELRKFLRSKSAANRAEQEEDVRARAQEKLATMSVSAQLLKAPVSISTYLAREQRQTREAMADAGFDRLYAALIAIIEPVLAYKRRKEAEVFLHHLEENVMSLLCRDVGALLDELRASSIAAAASLEQRQQRVADRVWRAVMPALPELLKSHAATRDVEAIRENLSRSIAESFVRAAETDLGDYEFDRDAWLAQSNLEVDAGFDEIVIPHGDAGGAPRTLAGVDYQRLHAALSAAIRDRIVFLARDAVRQCGASIAGLMKRADSLQVLLQTREKDLLHLKQKLRATFP
jgi:predicted GTPase